MSPSLPTGVARSVCGSKAPSLLRLHPAWARAPKYDDVDVVSQTCRSPRPCRSARAEQSASRSASPIEASSFEERW